MQEAQMLKLPMSLLTICILSCSAAEAALEQPGQKTCNPFNMDVCVNYDTDDSTPVPRLQMLLNQFQIPYRMLNKYMFGEEVDFKGHHKFPENPTPEATDPTIMCIDGKGCVELK
jgi:hypothetical protein